MKIIATATLKGGTGKTMTTFQLAGELAYQGNRVLLVDTDPQCNLTANCGQDSTDLNKPSVRDIFNNRRTKFNDIIVKTPLAGLEGLDLIPSNIMLTETEMNLSARSNREGLLFNWIEDNRNDLDYDYILFDTNPSMGLVNQNVFRCADSIILVTDVDYNAIQGAQMFTYLWGKRREDLRLDDNVKALIVNNSDKRINLSGDLQDYIQSNEELSGLFVKPVIKSRVALKNSVGESKPVALTKGESKEEYAELIKSLKEKGVL